MRAKYDLEERTEKFAKDVRMFVRSLRNDIANKEDIRQLVRSSGSIAANYIEANEALSKKDFMYRIKICRKEAKESAMWLRLVDEFESKQILKEKIKLVDEATQLLKIFSKLAQV